MRPSPPLTFPPTASHPPEPPPLITPLLCLLSGWLLHHLSSCRCLPSVCASGCCVASHCWLSHCLSSHRRLLSACAFASHHALAVALPLITPPPLVCLYLCLSLCPSCASCPAGCCITSHYAAAFHLSAPSPLIAPLSHLLSSWLSSHLSSCCRLLSACTSDHLHSIHHCNCHRHHHHCHC